MILTDRIAYVKVYHQICFKTQSLTAEATARLDFLLEVLPKVWILWVSARVVY